jgi:hypothetical protein
VDHQRFIDWSITKLRTFWIVFFSLFIGFYLAVALSFDPLSKGQTFFLMLISVFIPGLINAVMIKVYPTVKTIEITKEILVKPNSGCGTIYIIRRSDGILKFGKAQRLSSRITEHQRDYKSKFNAVASWVVPDMDCFESLALSLTKRYSYREGNRRELREMSQEELSKFILTFTDKVQGGWMQ